MAQPAVFLDRDGTLIEDADFLSSADLLRIMPNAIPGLKKLREAGYLVVVVTNQSGVARGLVSAETLEAIHARLSEQVETLGARLDGIYSCPHLPEGAVAEYAVECECRKPKPGLFLRARDELGIDLERSFAVGDAWRDVEAAWAAGVPSVKLPRPAGREESAPGGVAAFAEARDLLEAAEKILRTTPEEARVEVRRRLEAGGKESMGTDAREQGTGEANREGGTAMRPGDMSTRGGGHGTQPSVAPGRGARQVVPLQGEDSMPTQGGGHGTHDAQPHTGSDRGAAVPQQPRPPAVKGEGSVEGMVQEILHEVRRIGRRQAQASESFDLTWMLAILGQLVAVLLAAGAPLVRARWTDEAPMWLLAAVFAQVFALTMFVLSRSRR